MHALLYHEQMLPDRSVVQATGRYVSIVWSSRAQTLLKSPNIHTDELLT